MVLALAPWMDEKTEAQRDPVALPGVTQLRMTELHESVFFPLSNDCNL